VGKAKMSQMADMYQDYVKNFRGQEEKMWRKVGSNGRKVRVLHPFEKMSGTEVGAVLSGIKAITEAKLKALMLDKWAVTKFDLPLEEMDETGEGKQVGPSFTIEGKSDLTSTELQGWFDKYLDKPKLPPAEANSSGSATSNESAKNPTGGVNQENPEDGVNG
jgi:hypothetical protein